MLSRVPFVGEICALLAAVCWSYATILFRRSGRSVPPLALNLFKNVLALLLFSATLFALRTWPNEPISGSDRWLLLLSGAIGIGVSDVLYFMTLNRVGAGLQAIITTSYSPSIIFLSVIFLHESLSRGQMAGVLLILLAVSIVAYARNPDDGLQRRTLARGVVFGLLSTATQAVAIVMVKPLLSRTPLLWANSWRLLGGVAASLLIFALLPARRKELTTVRNPAGWRTLIPGAVMGSYVSLLFWLGGMKFTQASTAAVINQTATLWTFLLAAVMLREPISRERVAALVLGMAGVALVTFA